MTSQNERDDLGGMKYINWVRCSTRGQVDTSIEDQLTLLNTYGERRGMIHAGDARLDGVSGLHPRVHEQVGELIDRKKEKNDFDVVLVHDFSRLTRMGALDGAHIEYVLRDAGIELVSVMDNVPPGEFADVFKSLKLTAANQQSKAIALATTRGAMTAILSGRVPHCNNTPYGTDRLVLAPNGQPRFLLHDFADRTQQKLDPKTRTVLEAFGRNAKSGSPNHYRMQRGDQVVLVPGAPEQVAVVRMIYELHHTQGWGEHRIAKELNDQGVPAPRGGPWSSRTAHIILTNPIYLGQGLTNQTAAGRHFMRSKDGPQPANRSHQELSKYRQPPRRLRTEDEWVWVQQPALAEFLPAAIRPLAKAEQEDFRRRRLTRTRPTPKQQDRHRETSFILKRRLTCAQTGRPLTGRTCGGSKGKKRFRYYGLTKGFGYPASKPIAPTKLLPAEPIEQLVVKQLAVVIRSMPQLLPAVKERLRQEQVSRSEHQPDLEALRRQRQQLHDQINFVVDELPTIGREAAKAKANELAVRLDQVESQIRQHTPKPVLSDKEIDRRVETVLGAVGDSVDLMRHLGRSVLERLLDLLLGKAVVDLNSRTVELEFRLPTWALESPESVSLALCHDSMTSREADGGMLLIRYRAFWINSDGIMYIGYGKAA
jgi:hypothetical protein